jgi:hypothetical protein
MLAMVFSISAQAKVNSAIHTSTSQNETAGKKTSTPILMNEPTYGGSGCPDGTVSVTLTEDRKSMSVLFDGFVAEAGTTTGVARDIKSCKMVIPITVPKGFQFAILKTDQRGFYSIPKKGTVSFESSYYLSSAKNYSIFSPKISKISQFKGEKEEEYTLSTEISPLLIWSPCGNDVNLHMDKRIIATTNSKGEDVMATIDSIDNAIDKKAEGFNLFWRRCK